MIAFYIGWALGITFVLLGIHLIWTLMQWRKMFREVRLVICQTKDLS